MKDHASAVLMAEKAGKAIIDKLVDDGADYDPLYDDPPHMSAPTPAPEKRRKKLTRTQKWQRRK